MMDKKYLKQARFLKAIIENEKGRSVKDLCFELGITTSYFYKLRKNYNGLELDQILKLKKINKMSTTKRFKKNNTISILHYVA